MNLLPREDQQEDENSQFIRSQINLGIGVRYLFTDSDVSNDGSSHRRSRSSSSKTASQLIKLDSDQNASNVSQESASFPGERDQSNLGIKVSLVDSEDEHNIEFKDKVLEL